MDPDAHRFEARERWERAAAGWESGGDAFQRGALPVSHRMVEAIAPQPGHTVLELAAGPGETGLLAAELVRPGGRLISTDGAEAMVALARSRAAQLGLEDMVEARPMELEWIDLEAASVDAVLTRFGLMHAVDPEASLREQRRVLRPGGRVAAGVWDAAAHNPWLAAPGEALRELGLAEPADPDAPGAFALSAPGRVEDLLYAAGFADVEREAVDVVFEASSADSWWATLMAISTTLPGAVEALPPADHYRLRDAVDARWSAFAAPDGSLRLPGRAVIVSASA